MKKSKSLPKHQHPTLSKTRITNPIDTYRTIKSSSYKPPKAAQDLYHRLKQNQLNTKFNERRNKLKIIYEDNREIYKKIMTKKSEYSKKELNKSSSSLNSSMRSRSRCSQFSQKSVMSKNSKASKSKSLIGYTTLKSKTKPKPTFNFININVHHLENDKVSQLKNIFSKTSHPKVDKQNTPQPSFSRRHFTQRLDLAAIKEKPLDRLPRQILRSTTNSRIKLGARYPKQSDNNMYLF